MNMTVNFLLQATRVLNVGNYDEDELKMIYNFLTSVDNDVLIDYNMNCTILSYDNDLHLYIEILDAIMFIYEEREEYEKCSVIKSKKEESIKIMNKTTI